MSSLSWRVIKERVQPYENPAVNLISDCYDPSFSLFCDGKRMQVGSLRFKPHAVTVSELRKSHRTMVIWTILCLIAVFLVASFWNLISSGVVIFHRVGDTLAYIEYLLLLFSSAASWYTTGFEIAGTVIRRLDHMRCQLNERIFGNTSIGKCGCSIAKKEIASIIAGSPSFSQDSLSHSQYCSLLRYLENIPAGVDLRLYHQRLISKLPPIHSITRLVSVGFFSLAVTALSIVRGAFVLPSFIWNFVFIGFVTSGAVFGLAFLIVKLLVDSQLLKIRAAEMLFSYMFLEPPFSDECPMEKYQLPVGIEPWTAAEQILLKFQCEGRVIPHCRCTIKGNALIIYTPVVE